MKQDRVAIADLKSIIENEVSMKNYNENVQLFHNRKALNREVFCLETVTTVYATTRPTHLGYFA
jgi:hypothetical protein